MPEEFCRDHSEVMRCLGALETGQKNQGEQITRIEDKLDGNRDLILAKIDEVKNTAQRKTMMDLVQTTKMKILFWVIAIMAVAFITGLVNVGLKAAGLK